MEIIKENITNSFAVKITVMEEAKAIGWAYLYVLRNDRHEEPFTFLENVYVEKEHRKSGIGTKLVEAAIEEAKKQGCYKLVGTSRYERKDVHQFYKRFGFKDHGLEFRLDLKESKVKQQD